MRLSIRPLHVLIDCICIRVFSQPLLSHIFLDCAALQVLRVSPLFVMHDAYMDLWVMRDVIALLEVFDLDFLFFESGALSDLVQAFLQLRVLIHPGIEFDAGAS